ncbi:MAG TPA: hypothetical protein VII92_00485, partial [Anaerolineae bacterium]
MDDAFLVGGDNREIGAGENGVLQGSGFKQRLLAQRFGEAVLFASVAGNDGFASCFQHGRAHCA